MSCKPICYKIAQSYQGLAGSPPQTVSYQKKKEKATEATPNFARASTHCLASINMYFTAGLENLCKMFLQSEGKGSINKFLQV